MTIMIDIRPLMDERYSGVAEYTMELLHALFEIDKKNKYILFYNSFEPIAHRLPVFSSANVRVVATRIPNKIFNYAFLKLLGRPYFDRLVKEPVDLLFLPHLNFVARSKKVPMILTVHDLSFLRYPEFFSWRKNIWHWFLGVKKLLRSSNQIITLAQHSKDDISRYADITPDHVSVIYSGIAKVFKKLEPHDQQLAAIKQKYSLPDRFILFLGTVEPRKNLPTLIKAFALLKEGGKYADIGLVIAGGRGWKSKSIYQEAAQSPYASQIKFLDYVPAEEKVFLYNLATVFVYPSFYEGFGFPPLEAMACGIPTIVSAASSLPEIVQHNALLIDPYNPASITTALKAVLSNQALYDHLAGMGPKQAAEFSWLKAAEQYLRLFERVAST